MLTLSVYNGTEKFSKPILCIDFDGVIHHYRDGWQDGVIYDTPTPGAFEWLEQAQQHFTLMIYSSRSKTPEGITAMTQWLLRHMMPWRALRPEPGDMQIWFAAVKPPAFLTLDDRAVQFTGEWPDPAVLRAFRPWNDKT